ncbi:unnamed protein product [Fusarium equiseti]|uniref:DUF6604 domain-containing protein n=1 Tax=Fusarium equiseti TaxID=61235 RepID=A0A8J2J0Y3_FUSEQ|nr:unnamed protein product [Fusarium equiseti]
MSTRRRVKPSLPSHLEYHSNRQLSSASVYFLDHSSARTNSTKQTPTRAKPAPPKPKGAGRLKSKARKEAKIQKASTPGRKYTIPIKDFIPLADYIIASTKPLIKVPASFAETIDRVIYMPSTFGSKMIDHGVERDGDKDASHNHFVGVLESVRSILRPRMPAGTPALTSFEDLTNRFSSLNIHEPSQEFLDAPELVRPKKEQSDDNDYEAELQKSFADAMMAYFVLLKDLNDIRSRIEWIWGNYQKGAFDPATAAVATNTAIDLARNLIEQVLSIFEEHGGAIKIAEKYSLMCVFHQGIPRDEALKEGPGTGNEKMYEEADKTFLNASLLLRIFTADLDPSAICVDSKQMMQEMFGGTYDPTSDRLKKDGHEKFKEDQMILGEVFLDTVTLTRLMPTFPVQDEFVRGILEWNQTGQVPFYLVFAAQVLLDIHHILREDAPRAFETMMTHTTAMRDDINLRLEFLAEVKMPNWPAQNTHALKEIE